MRIKSPQIKEGLSKIQNAVVKEYRQEMMKRLDSAIKDYPGSVLTKREVKHLVLGTLQ